ncbi:MAG: hypothetical protein ACJA2S_004742 [Cyclobacteriaceae bacterium]|jgi:hypothetical protein
MVRNLISFFKKSKEETKKQVPEGICPNCWGKQAYDNQVRELYRDKQIDINNHEANHAFIQDFAVKHLSGIHLKKKDSSYQCPTCKVKY